MIADDQRIIRVAIPKLRTSDLLNLKFSGEAQHFILTILPGDADAVLSLETTRWEQGAEKCRLCYAGSKINSGLWCDIQGMLQGSCEKINNIREIFFCLSSLSPPCWMSWVLSMISLISFLYLKSMENVALWVSCWWVEWPQSEQWKHRLNEARTTFCCLEGGWRDQELPGFFSPLATEFFLNPEE